MPSDEEVLQEAIRICEPHVMTDMKLGDTAYENLGVPFDSGQWRRVWIDFLDAGGDFTILPNGARVVSVCPVPEGDVQDAEETVERSSPSAAHPDDVGPASTAADNADRPTPKPWPPTTPERYGAVKDVLNELNRKVSVGDIKARFDTRTGTRKFQEILDTLVVLGLAVKQEDGYRPLS